jgi:hypothetical protein
MIVHRRIPMSALRLDAIPITHAIADAIEAIGRAMRNYEQGQMSAGVIEIPKLALAEAVLAAVREQLIKAQAEGRATALAQVRRPLPVGVVEVELRRKRRRKQAS